MIGSAEVRDVLHERGAAHIGMLGAAEVDACLAIAHRAGIDPGAGFWASNLSAPRPLAVELDEALLPLVHEPVARSLPGMRAVKAVVISKGAVGQNWVNVHQDWDYVDEARHRGYVAWCPLVDVGPDDGLLHVIAGSHRWLDNRRGSGAFPQPFAPHAARLERSGTAVPVAAGEAIVYDNALLHYSPPNDGGTQRLVLAVVVVPHDAAVIHLHSTDGASAERFTVDPRIFTAAPHSARPPGVPDDIVALDHHDVSDDDLDRWLA